MTHVLIKRGSLETDIHAKRAPFEDEGIALQTRNARDGQNACSGWGRPGLGFPSQLSDGASFADPQC